MGWMADESGLEKCEANYVPLTPLSHLRRAAKVFPDKTALIYGENSWNYSQYHARVSRLASALAGMGIQPGEVVATILPNVAAHAEALFGVPASGAVINTINIRLDVDTVAHIFAHGEAKIALVDTQFIELAEAASARMDGTPPILIEVPDIAEGFPATGRHKIYEDLLQSGQEDFDWVMPDDEWESLSLNYTSGTTGNPKGVVYHHRGAYLHSLGVAVDWALTRDTRYLVIVPLFHCNNWVHTWTMPAIGAAVVCCRNITAKAIYDAIADSGVTHFAAAPIVLNAIVNAHDDDRRAFDHVVAVYTAGAPPPAATLAAIEPLGFDVTQVYGLTETYGHIGECIWREDRWGSLGDEEKFAFKARTGVGHVMCDDLTVMDPETMMQIPMDGETTGEIMIRANSVMKGYLKNPDATAKAFAGGYFHSEDVALQFSDGYVKITDRSKDIIISGGENVSSVEVEAALMHHPAVSLSAVVAKQDDKWGEVPCAFVELKEGSEVSEDELIAFARERLAGFKTPKQVIFQELPKTSTGKIQKFELRKIANAL